MTAVRRTRVSTGARNSAMTRTCFHMQETKYTCGAASMRMALEACGVKKTERYVAKLIGTNTVRGTWHRGFPVAAERFRLDYSVRRDATIADLRRFLRDGYTVIVCYLYPPERVDHYAVVKRIGTARIELWDPWWGPEHTFTLGAFKKLWHSDPRYDNERAWCIAMRPGGGRA